MENNPGNVSVNLFTAQDLWDAVESSSKPRRDCEIAARLAISLVQRLQTPLETTSDYYKALARQFDHISTQA